MLSGTRLQNVLDVFSESKMTVRGQRIILYGHFGSGNIGNDSSLAAMLHAIKKYCPSADLICICDDPQIVAERYQIKTLQIGPQHEMVEEAASNRGLSIIRKLWRRVSSEIEFWIRRPGWFQRGDQFIIVGTGAVDDMAVRHFWNAPYELYRWCSVAKWGGARLVFLSVGVGPIENRINRFLMLTALSMADYRSYRETAALEYLKSVGYKTTGDLLYPDLVFSLPSELLPVSRGVSAQATVGLGLINYQGWRHDPDQGETIYQAYISKIKRFVSWLLDKGYSIRIISGDTIDQRPVQEIVDYVSREKTGQGGKLIVEPITDVNRLFEQIAQTDIVVASRFHNVLCSLMLERPVISLGYHAKNDALMSEMELASYCQHIETFTFEKLVEQFEHYAVEIDEAVRRIHRKNQMYRDLLDEQYRTILGMNVNALHTAGHNKTY